MKLVAFQKLPTYLATMLLSCLLQFESSRLLFHLTFWAEDWIRVFF